MPDTDRHPDAGFRFFFANHPLPMWVYDLDGLAFLAVNQAAIDSYGYTEEEFLGLTLYDIRPAEHHAALRGSHANRPPAGSFAGEWIHCRRDGSPRRIRVYAQPITWNQRAAHLSVLVDVTEDRAAAEALREMRERQNHLLGAVRGVVLRLRRADDGSPRFDYISPHLASLEGLDPAEVLEDPDLYLSRIHREDFDNLLTILHTSEQTMSTLSWEGRFRAPAGGTVWRHLDGMPLALPDGSVAWDGLLTDTTATREYEAALERSKHLLEESQHLARMGSWEWELDSGRMTWSAEMFRLSGYSQEAFTPDFERLLARVDREDRTTAESRIGLLRQAPGEVSWRMRIRHPGGRLLWILCHGESFADTSGQPQRIVCIEQDITDDIEREEEQSRLQARMEQASRFESLSILAGGIAHDFNNLLAGIIGYVDLALAELSPMAPGREYLRNIQKAALRAADLTRQMLAYSGRGHFIIEPINLTRLLEEMPHLLRTVISPKAVLRFDFNQATPDIAGDKTQLRQIIMNLIINASEAIGDTSGIITIRTGTLLASREYLEGTWLDLGLHDGLYSYFEVSDTGHGMSSTIRTQIFDPFFTTKDTGHGLGLAAALGIIRGHKGFIKVYSEQGKGTTFKVGFPSIAERATETPAPNGGPARHHTGRILVADDEEAVRTITAKCLEKLGFEVLHAGNGREALDLFREGHAAIRAVLLDLTMPQLSGDEVFREIRLIDPSIPVILMSGFTEEDAVSRFVGRGLAGFLQKPFRFDELREKIEQVLGN